MAGYGGSPFPVGSSPYGYAPAPLPQPFNAPGTLTFTTETDKRGRPEYHIFRAEPRTIAGPQGPIEGIQWVAVDIAERPPLDAVPAGPEFRALWGLPQISEREHERNIKEWEREHRAAKKAEERELEQEQKLQHEKAIRQWEREQKAIEDDEFRRARHLSSNIEWDAKPNTRGRSRSRARFAQDELTREMAGISLNSHRSKSRARSRSRHRAAFGDDSAIPTPLDDYYDRSDRHGFIPPQPRGGPPVGYGSSPGRRVSYSNRASPYAGGTPLPVFRDGSVYPPGHALEGQPILADEFLPTGSGYRARSRSRSRSPLPQASSSRQRRGSMSARNVQGPDAFTRQPSQAVPYTYFDPIAILRDINYLRDELPPLPGVLDLHDVHWEEWDECLEELRRAWFVERDIRKRDQLAARIIDVWNSCFFAPRGVELVLLRGGQRRSGPQIGLFDPIFGGQYEDDSEDSGSDSLTSDSDYDQSFGYYWNTRYGTDPWMMESRAAKHARKEAKRLKRQRRNRSRHASRAQPYRLLLTCVDGGRSSMGNLGRSPRRSYAPSLI